MGYSAGSNSPLRASPDGERQTVVLGSIRVELSLRFTTLLSNRPLAMYSLLVFYPFSLAVVI